MNRYKNILFLGIFVLLFVPLLLIGSHFAENKNEEQQATNGHLNNSEEENDGNDKPAKQEEKSDPDQNNEEKSDHEDQQSADDNKEAERDKEENSEKEENQTSEDDANQRDEDSHVWGVDSASTADENAFQCVIDHFGEPAVWGRYIGDREDVSVGLTKDEVTFLHDHDIQVLPIYNHANDVTGYENGTEHAKLAVKFAEELDMPDGTAIFLNIEPEYPVDSAFLEAWYDMMMDSPYHPAIYGVFDEGSHLLTAYHAMPEEMQKDTIVWTAYPQSGVTSQANAPEYDPDVPKHALAHGWQYGLEAESCHMDTNLFQQEVTDYLW